MRLWSLHPRYLDVKGLVALWREALLAQKVLLGSTRGYRNHPQLLRFRNCDNPPAAIAAYLHCVCDEGERRGYRFDRSKIGGASFAEKITVTRGQLCYEQQWLLEKLKKRDLLFYNKLTSEKKIEAHPLFTEIEGEREKWEKGSEIIFFNRG